MNEHTILVAFTVEGESKADAEGTLLYRLSNLNRNMVTSFWVAEDDRIDRSDCDSAVFVTPGFQPEASQLLHHWGMTPACNVIPNKE